MEDNEIVVCPCGWSGKWWEAEFLISTDWVNIEVLHQCPECNKEVTDEN